MFVSLNCVWNVLFLTRINWKYVSKIMHLHDVNDEITNTHIWTLDSEPDHISHKLLSVSWPRQISLTCCGIFWIHTQTTSDTMYREKIFFTVYTQHWHSTSGSHAGHNHQKSSALLFHRQAIITAIRLGGLVNLNLGITLWHQGEEDVLCCVLVHRSWN